MCFCSISNLYHVNLCDFRWILVVFRPHRPFKIYPTIPFFGIALNWNAYCRSVCIWWMKSCRSGEQCIADRTVAGNTEMLLFETSSLSNLLLEVNAVNVIKQTVIISLGSCVSISTMTAQHSFSLKPVCLLDQVCDLLFEYSADYHTFRNPAFEIVYFLHFLG